MTGLVEFLTARLDEDERIARAATERAPWSHNADDYWMITGTDGDVVVYDESAPTDAEAAHIARHDPARVLADVAAKRAILTEHLPDMAREYRDGAWRDRPQCGACVTWRGEGEAVPAPAPCLTLRRLAVSYADHPDFDESWRVAAIVRDRETT